MYLGPRGNPPPQKNPNYTGLCPLLPSSLHFAYPPVANFCIQTLLWCILKVLHLKLINQMSKLLKLYLVAVLDEASYYLL